MSAPSSASAPAAPSGVGSKLSGMWHDASTAVAASPLLAAATAAGVAALAYVAVKAFKKPPPKPERKNGVVYLGILSRTSFSPNASPFCLKLETWLRMAGVSYEVIPEVSWSPATGKSPFIEYNGEHVCDSTLAAQFLSARPELKVDIDAKLTPAELAVGHAFRVMADENLYWGLIYNRWCANPDAEAYLHEAAPDLSKPLRWMLTRMIQSKNRKAAFGHGIGRHSDAEVFAICEKDVTAISEYLGTKPYFLGERATSIDAALFGHLSALAWSPYECRLTKHVKSFANIEAYLVRIRDKYWPDWNDHLKPNGSKAWPPAASK